MSAVKIAHIQLHCDIPECNAVFVSRYALTGLARDEAKRWRTGHGWDYCPEHTRRSYGPKAEREEDVMPPR